MPYSGVMEVDRHKKINKIVTDAMKKGKGENDVGLRKGTYFQYMDERSSFLGKHGSS